MADQKLTELTELTSASGDDLTYIVDDPGGSPLSRKITIANLIAGGWIVADAMTYSSADDPTYVMTCSGDKTATYYAGQRIKLSQSTGGTKYFIITKVEYSNPNTVITMYGGTDYNLENEAITSPFYSIAKAPAGFPLDPTKWTVETIDTSLANQDTPTQNTWYNLGSINISIPIGIWNVRYTCNIGFIEASTIVQVQATLSTANNSESDANWTTHMRGWGDTGSSVDVPTSCFGVISITSKATYYMNARTLQASIDKIRFLNGQRTIIRAVCAYL